MITVITGQPGSGKTALCVSMLSNIQGRPIVVMGIDDLKIDHQPAPPVSEWVQWRKSPEDETLSLPYFLFPQNAVVVIDECQRVFRPRASGSKVPAEVQAFETHRHTGVDFILLTQHVGLVDPNIRKLVGKHIHVRVTPFGRYLYEWTELGDPESPSSRELAARSSYKLPKKFFDLYKSAELHTKVSRKMPAYVWLFGFVVVSAIGLAGYTYTRVKDRINPQPIAGKTLNQPTGTSAPGPTPQTASQLVASYTPRLEGLHHTAPAYDGITKPVDAPVPVGCLKTATKCRCVDQQGNNYATTSAVCESFIRDGMFIAWKQPRKLENPFKSSPPQHDGASIRATDTPQAGPVPVEIAGNVASGS